MKNKELYAERLRLRTTDPKDFIGVAVGRIAIVFTETIEGADRSIGDIMADPPFYSHLMRLLPPEPKIYGSPHALTARSPIGRPRVREAYNAGWPMETIEAYNTLLKAMDIIPSTDH